MINSDRHLRCLSWNSVLKLVAISSSSFSPQIIGGTNRTFPASVSSLEKEDNEKKEEDEEGDEDSEAGDEVLTFWTGRVAVFFFWIGGRTMELEA